MIKKILIQFIASVTSIILLVSCGGGTTGDAVTNGTLETSAPKGETVDTSAPVKSKTSQYATTVDAKFALTFTGLNEQKQDGTLVTIFSTVKYIGAGKMEDNGTYIPAVYLNKSDIPSGELVNTLYEDVVIKSVIHNNETLTDTRSLATSIKYLYVKVNGYDGVYIIDLDKDSLTQTIDVNKLAQIDNKNNKSAYLGKYISDSSPVWLSAEDTEWNYVLDQYGKTSSISTVGGILEQYKPGTYSNGIFTINANTNESFGILEEEKKGIITSNLIDRASQPEIHPEYFVKKDANGNLTHTPIDFTIGINSVDSNGNSLVEGDVFVTFYFEGAGYRSAFGFYPYYDAPDLNQTQQDALSPEALTLYNQIKSNPTPQEMVSNFSDQGYLLPYYYFKSLISGANRVPSAKIIFANASKEGSGGELGWGDTIKIGRYPAKTKFIFFIVPDGWDTSNGGVKTGNTVYSSYSALNPELAKSYFDNNYDEGLFTYYSDTNNIVPDHVHMAVLKTPIEDINGDGILTQTDIDLGGSYIYVLGFEDLFRLGGSDNDFEDIVFSVSMIPDGALGNGDSNTTLTTIAEPDDADGDGIKDNVDEFPGTDCPSTIINNVTVYTVGTDCYNYNHARAYRSYTPSAGTYGTLLYEDNWEYGYDYFGDYDMNDVILRYNVEEQKDANQSIKTIIMDMEIQADSASYSTGFSIHLPRTLKENIESYKLENISRYTNRSTLDMLKEFTVTDYLTSTLEPAEYIKDCQNVTYDVEGNVLTVTDDCGNSSGTIFDITDSIERIMDDSLFDFVQNADNTVINQMTNMGNMRSPYTGLVAPDNQDNIKSEHIRLKITFNTPVASSQISTPPYNPFIVVAHSATEMQTKQQHIANGETNIRREIHLPSSNTQNYLYTGDAKFNDNDNAPKEDYLSDYISSHGNGSEIKMVATTWLKKMYDDGFMTLDPTFWTDTFGATAQNLFVLQSDNYYYDEEPNALGVNLYRYKLPWAININSSFKHICTILGPDVIFDDTETFYDPKEGRERKLADLYDKVNNTPTDFYLLLRDHGLQIYFAYPYYIYWVYSGFTKHTDWYKYPITSSYFDDKFDAAVLAKYRKLFNCSSDPILSDSFKNRLAEEQ